MIHAADPQRATPVRPTLVARADAGAQRGAGHVMRCLALMQAWNARDGACILATHDCPDALASQAVTTARARIARLHSPPGSAGDAEETAEVAAAAGASWIVVDGYDFDAGYVQHLRQRGYEVLLLDDLGRRGRTNASIVLNQNLHAVPEFYAADDASTTRLLGPDFLLLRQEFRRWRGWVRTVPPVARRVGLSLGGADPEGHTTRLLRALAHQCIDAELTVVVGAANPALASIEQAARAAAGRVSVRSNITDMASFLSEVDLLVSSAGATVWEGAFLSTPMLLGTVGPQEEALARRLAEAKACVDLGPFAGLDGQALFERVRALIEDRETRAGLTAACRRLVDGQGCERVVEAMLERQ